MTTLLELRTRNAWNEYMPATRWTRWDDEEDDALRADILRFAVEISRDAFQDGVFFGVNHPTGTNGDMQKEMDKRYAITKPQYRCSRRDSNGNYWQVRDGRTWVSTELTKWVEHVEVEEVIGAMARLKKYDDIAILLDVVQNPTL